MAYSNVFLCKSLRAWNYDPEKIHAASEQIDKLFDCVTTGLFSVEFSMSAEKQCLIAKILFKADGESNRSSTELKALTRDIAGVLSDIYCGGNDDDILIHNHDTGVSLEIHQNPSYDDE